jgi:hypothetical protein
MRRLLGIAALFLLIAGCETQPTGARCEYRVDCDRSTTGTPTARCVSTTQLGQECNGGMNCVCCPTDPTAAASTGIPACTATSGTQDAGGTDTGAADTGVMDTGVMDTGVMDTGVMDTGVTDTGVVDVVPGDGSAADGGAMDAQPGDASAADATTSSDAAAD